VKISEILRPAGINRLASV